MPTNATEQVTGIYTYFKWVQETSAGQFFLWILFGLFILFYLSIKQYTSNGRAFLASSFFCMAISAILTVLQLLNSMYAYAFILLTGIGVVWSYLENRVE
ncbi:hypothetical protein [uncultured Arcobacter sp.]|uniref:hypothetical protein n=1 Tax=uncultured Arcobacter sp. TaxID=165434 RepID=UPI00261DA7BB|nr:hypothetical protein [uncultured Arcobacter sp.]